MKRFKWLFKGLSAFLLGVCVLPAAAQFGPGMVADPVDSADSIGLSLITCGPGREIYSQYGHTAVRVRLFYGRNGNVPYERDLAFNYGMFSSHQPYFIPRFVFGLTDYKVDVLDFRAFCYEYEYEGRSVTEQVLNLSQAEKYRIAKALQENVSPENQTYRYNFFYDNCTTRARDIIVGHLAGKVDYPALRPGKVSFRDMIHQWNNPYPWASFGEDLLLGVNADRACSVGEQQFLPQNLFDDFAKATYRGRPLVGETRQLLPQRLEPGGASLPLSPVGCSLLLLAVSLIVAAVECRRHVVFWGWDLALMLASGLVGVILTLMIFSKHPCVSLNLLLFFFNPIPLAMAWRAVKRTRRHQPDRWWTVWGVLLLLGFAGGLLQSYPSAIWFVALSLLSRPVLHIYESKKTAA